MLLLLLLLLLVVVAVVAVAVVVVVVVAVVAVVVAVAVAVTVAVVAVAVLIFNSGHRLMASLVQRVLERHLRDRNDLFGGQKFLGGFAVVVAVPFLLVKDSSNGSNVPAPPGMTSGQAAQSLKGLSAKW